jgi:hypothetical protein
MAASRLPGVRGPRIGGPQTRPFILHPVELAVPAEPIVGAASVHEILKSWRDQPTAAGATSTSLGAVYSPGTRLT